MPCLIICWEDWVHKVVFMFVSCWTCFLHSMLPQQENQLKISSWDFLTRIESVRPMSINDASMSRRDFSGTAVSYFYTTWVYLYNAEKPIKRTSLFFIAGCLQVSQEWSRPRAHQHPGREQHRVLHPSVRACCRMIPSTDFVTVRANNQASMALWLGFLVAYLNFKWCWVIRLWEML